MKLEQIYTGCIAHAAYYLESNGEAAIFDPLREVQPYLDRAKADRALIKYVFETHFHADFVSGHLDLKKKANAEIVFGPTAKPNYEATTAEDNQIFLVGKCKVKVIHTPGHTMESTTFLIIDEEGKEHGIITGDTLFIGDVGRPDLAQHVIADLTQDKLAGYLFDSLRNKIMPLSDDLIVYPNHGAGSACGKMMSKETTDTLGHQKRVNYALDPKLSKEEFIEIVLSGLTNPPVYFPQNVLLNIRGYESLDVVLERASSPLNVDAFQAAANETSALILVTEPGREKECAIRLSRVGYDNTLGYLEGGMKTWIEAGKEIDQSKRISPLEFANEISSKKILVIDVRKKSEFDSEHVLDSLNIPLNEINVHLSSIPKTEKFLLICAGGYRSMIAASILRQRGWNNFVDVEGGFAEIKKTNAPCSSFVCPTTLL